MKYNRWILLIAFLLISFSIAGLGALLTDIGTGSWYSQLVKPSFQPPDFVFAPVWTALYALIAISGWIVYISVPSFERSRSLHLWWWQLALNLLWTILFFSLHSPLLAWIDIFVLLLIILSYMIVTTSFASPSAWLFVPYVCGVLFASFLNLAILILN